MDRDKRLWISVIQARDKMSDKYTTGVVYFIAESEPEAIGMAIMEGRAMWVTTSYDKHTAQVVKVDDEIVRTAYIHLPAKFLDLPAPVAASKGDYRDTVGTSALTLERLEYVKRNDVAAYERIESGGSIPGTSIPETIQSAYERLKENDRSYEKLKSSDKNA